MSLIVNWRWIPPRIPLESARIPEFQLIPVDSPRNTWESRGNQWGNEKYWNHKKSTVEINRENWYQVRWYLLTGTQIPVNALNLFFGVNGKKRRKKQQWKENKPTVAIPSSRAACSGVSFQNMVGSSMAAGCRWKGREGVPSWEMAGCR